MSQPQSHETIGKSIGVNVNMSGTFSYDGSCEICRRRPSGLVRLRFRAMGANTWESVVRFVYMLRTLIFSVYSVLGSRYNNMPKNIAIEKIYCYSEILI